MCDDVSKPLADGLPETLEDAINVYGYRYFKLKISGDIATDLERLNRIANVLDRISKVYYVTLDGNEQYTDTRQISELWRRIVADPVLHRFSQAVLFIEQPLNRDIALQQDVAELSREKPVIIDESDMAPDSFVKAKQRGYKGVSSKSCKGIYRSLINAARCAHWNHQEHGGYFLTAEDLSTQAGLALQQDLALVCLLGIEHVERNGHFYGGGFSPQQPVEAQSFLQAHPDLYGENDHQQVQLRITEGKIHTSSLRRSGFASDAEPDWSVMSVMVNPQKPQNA
jgi:L-alanine-DL-glutamate epimerase-like enolase superfamily enzyme